MQLVPRIARSLLLLSLLFAALLVASGCSSDSTGGAPAPAPPTPDTTDTAPAGVLRVRIVGLPAGIGAAVAVSGPNGFMRTVDSDVDLEVAPGAYTVSAGLHGGEGGASLLAPVASSQDAQVAPDRGVTVRVEYESLETKLQPDVKRIAADALRGLVSVTRNPDGGGTLVFGAASSETASWKPGDVILLPSMPAAPEGFAGRVATSDGVTVVAGPVSLQEIYASGGFHLTRQLTDDDVSSFVPSAQMANVSFGVHGSLSTSIKASKGPAQAAFTITGAVDFYPSVTCDVWVTKNLALHAYFRLTSTTVFSLTGEAAVGLEASGSTTLGRVSYFPIDVGPVTVTPEVDLRVYGSASVAAGVYAGVELTTSTDSGFGFDSDQKPTFRSWGAASESFKPIWPTPFASAAAGVRAGPQLNLLIEGVAGPFAGVRGVVEFALDPLGAPLWTLKGGLDMDVGIATASFIGKTYTPPPVWSTRYAIATSNDTPPIGATTARRANLPGGYGVAIGPDDTIYLASGKNVTAAKKTGEILWSLAGDDLIQRVLRGPDGTIYATDFSTNIYAIDASGTLKWKKPAALSRGLALGDAYVYTTTFGTQAALEAYALADGTSWSVPLSGGNWSVSVAKDGTIYALTDAIHAIDPTSHAELWSGGAAGASSFPPAIGDDGTLYQIDDQGSIVATNADGTHKWTSLPAFSDEYAGVAIGPSGTIYSCSLDHVRSVSATGGILWNVKIPGNQPFCRNTPSVGQDGRIYVSTIEGLYVFESNGLLAWSALTSQEDSRTSPAFLSTKEVVVAERESLKVFYAGTTAPTNGWPREGGGSAATGRKQ
jgi:hypothetical protein